MKVKVTPRSDQWNGDDFIGGPRTFTVSHVVKGVATRPYDIHFSDGDGRAWRPPNGVLTLLIEAWSDETSTWAGRQVTLYRDPRVVFAGDPLGGIRVSHMSDLPGGKPFTAQVTVSRGKKGPMTAQPLTTKAPTDPVTPSVQDTQAGTGDVAPVSADPTPAYVEASADVEQLRAWAAATKRPQVKAAIDARIAELDAAIEPEPMQSLLDGEKPW